MVGIRSPDGLVVGSCTSHPGVLGSIPKREKQPRPGWAPDPLMVGIRSPDGLVVGLAPATLGFGFDSQTRGTRENRRTLC
jgi:hypothetical protein